jgi:hypothetical protein
MLIDQFVSPKLELLQIHARDARHVLAARSWCILRRAGQDPLPRLGEYLLSDGVARRFSLLMEAVTQVWPEPFGIHRPCCPTASLDEGVLIHSIQLAALDARPQFENLLREMLSEDARDLLFARAKHLYVFDEHH